MERGFTLLEVMLVIGIMLILAFATAPFFGNLVTSSELDAAENNLIQSLRLARDRADAGLNNSSHGVFVGESEDGFYAVLFEGDSYASRDQSKDEIINLGERFDISTTLPGNEAVFTRGSALPSGVGSIIITDPSGDEREIILGDYGLVGTDRCGLYEWTFDNPSQYNFDSGVINVAGGFARLIETVIGYSGIGDVPVSDFAFSGGFPIYTYQSFLTISPGVVAVLYSQGANIYVQTIEVAQDGRVVGMISKKLVGNGYTGFDGRWHNKFYHVDGDIFAALFVGGTGSDPSVGHLVTMSISQDGKVISSEKDRYTFSNDIVDNNFDMVNSSDNIYAITYSNGTPVGRYLKTVEINETGMIGDAYLDLYPLDHDPLRVLKRLNNLVVIVGGGDDLYLNTLYIDDSGQIEGHIGKEYLDEYVDTAPYPGATAIGEIEAEYVADDIIAVYYQFYFNPAIKDSVLATFEVNRYGDIVKKIDEEVVKRGACALGKTFAQYLSLSKISGGTYGLGYETDTVCAGDTSPFNTRLRIYEIDTLGMIGPKIDEVSISSINNRESANIICPHPDVCVLPHMLESGISDTGYMATYVLEGVRGYDKRGPSVTPSRSFNPGAVITWDSFTENAEKEGGEIYYQLSDNDGVNWKYWDGSAWVLASKFDYNTASVVNSKISLFPTDTGKIMFNAILSSDGTKAIGLGNLAVSCTNFVNAQQPLIAGAYPQN